MKTDVPEHILAQIKPLKEEGRSVAEIAFMLRLDESVVQDWLTTTNQSSRADKGLKRPSRSKP